MVSAIHFIVGGDLHTFLQEHFEQLDNWSKFELFKDIMEGVRFTHSKLIVHADIKCMLLQHLFLLLESR